MEISLEIFQIKFYVEKQVIKYMQTLKFKIIDKKLFLIAKRMQKQVHFNMNKLIENTNLNINSWLLNC